MRLPDTLPTTEKELAADALYYAKYPSDVRAMIYLNEVLEELSFKMKAGTFQVFKERINTMLNA
jgi:hypothetical protein